MHRLIHYRIVLTSMLAALICVLTILVPIPIPATGGYANPGDGLILTCAFLLPPASALMAAGLGSALADLLIGYAVFAPGTFFIKGGMALIAALISHRFGNENNRRTCLWVRLAASVAAEVFMVTGYFLYESLCLGYGLSAMASVPLNLGQGALGIVVSTLLLSLITRSRELTALLDKAK
ncbi:MAG: ECF transporter S component [Christensenellales bacterium]|nr:ECF transporter S component [Christensenellales bacterium]